MYSLPSSFDEQSVAVHGAAAGLDDASLAILRDLTRRIATDVQLREPASTLHHVLFHTDDNFAPAVNHADRAFGADAGVLHALLVLDSMRLVGERQAARGVPANIAQAIRDRFGGAWLREGMRQGNIGLTYWNPEWVRISASGDLVRLGRLEFLPLAWKQPFRVYTHASSGEVVVLALPGQRFTDEGLLVGDTTWDAMFEETDDAIIGTPVSPHGIALPRLVRLPKAEWNLALTNGDAVLDMHVPGEGALSIPVLRDAMAEAVPFFERFYPDHHFVAYVCDSWLFSPQLADLLGPASNIVRWQREGYMVPSHNDQSDFLAFTFGSNSIDLLTAPRDTRLRRAVIDHLAAGKTLCCGRSILLRPDLERFGTQPYQGPSSEAIDRLTFAM